MKNPDVIVLGLGGMGTAAVWHLARRGLSVLGLEQFALGHDRGSSHGHSRIIRQAYYEHPAYVPLVRRAYEGWYDLEQAVGRVLLVNIPCLTLGPPEGELVQGVCRSAAEHGLPIEGLSAESVAQQFPAFRPQGLTGVVESTAGVLLVDDCVQSMAAEARRLGARLQEHEPVLHWTSEGSGYMVQTVRDQYRAARLVLTAGPWAGQLLGDLGQPLRVMRQVAFWFQPVEASLFRRDRFPVFIADTPGGLFYGMPALDAKGIKVAQHYGAEELGDPTQIQREVTDSDEYPVRAFLDQFLPSASGPRTKASVCIYTLSPDRHFLIGQHPAHSGVVLAAGFSGHGFKFAPVVGEILADLTCAGASNWPIDLFAVTRFAGGCPPR